MRLELAVECERMTVKYGEFTAVDELSFHVGAGEVFGLLGPNGAGKTSLVRALSTIVEPASGEARISGVPLTEPNRVRRLIGVLPESNGYPGAVAAIEYLVYFGQLYGLGRTEASRRATALLADLGLSAVAVRPIQTFSRGMRQRLGIARALINQPAVLILDEPTLGLDPAGREDVFSSISLLAEEMGVSVILSSHLLDDVERVCDRIAILNAGKLVASGSVTDVIQKAKVGNEVTIAVSPPLREKAIAHLNGHPDVRAHAPHERDPRLIVIELHDDVGEINRLLQTLTDAEVPIYEVQRRSPRLSDAFLALTGPGEP